MADQNLHFELGDFSKVFPFFFLLNEEGRITHVGTSFQKLFPDAEGMLAGDMFSLLRPQLADLSPASIRCITDQLVVLQVTHMKSLTLRGQFHQPGHSSDLLFIGAPFFQSTDEMNAAGLDIADFAPHNQQVDMLYLLHSQEIANRELKELLSTINRQKNTLLRQNEEIQKMAYTLEENNKRYAYVNQATSEAIWDWNILTGEVYYGDGFQKLFGYETGMLPMPVNIWEKRIHKNDFERISQNIQRALDSTETRWKDEYLYLKENGEYAHVLDKGIIIRDDKGHPLRMIGSMQDVTQQKNEELRLRMLETVITNTNDGVLITTADDDNSIIFANDAILRMSGYSRSELMGKNPRILQGPLSNKEGLKAMKEAIARYEPCEITTINYRKNGEAYWVQFRITPIPNEKGEYTHWVSVERDITTIRRAQEEIQQQKNFTEDILNNIPTDIAVFDPQHHYLFLNPHAIRDNNLRSWMINKTDFDYAKAKGIDDGFARTRRGYFEEAVRSNSKVEWMDELVRPNGINYVQRCFYPYFENQKLKFVIGFGVDVTAQKVIEIKLNEAFESIKRSNAELEQFAYVASHDLQEPLRMVSSFLSQLEKKYADNLDDRAREYIRYAVDGAKRMRQIIQDLLEYSRAGKTEDRAIDIPLGEILDEVCILHSRQIEELGAEIIYTTLPTVKGHKAPLRQLFQNLISNSLKYHRKGVPPRIRVLAVEEGPSWHFSISDNGIGIDPQYFERIFVIFQRLHNRDEYSGTGIGLAITKKIVDQLGGRIWVESVPDQGSTFHVTLPRQS